MSVQINNLNNLLASVSIAIANAKVYHWLIKGDKFFVFHPKFQEFYDVLAEHQDKIAERVIMLNHVPLLGYSNYIVKSKILETKLDGQEVEIIREILVSIDVLIGQAQEVKKSSKEVGDDETDNYMQELIYEMQKLHWQYSVQV
jgi:starvation-inducible DNA-binding protein